LAVDFRRVDGSNVRTELAADDSLAATHAKLRMTWFGFAHLEAGLADQFTGREGDDPNLIPRSRPTRLGF